MSSSPARRLPSSRGWGQLAAAIAAACGCLLPVTARADGQLWVLASVTKTIATDWRVNAEVSPRWERDLSDYTKASLRAQVSRMVSGSLALNVGYEYQDPASMLARREHRIWQQAQVRQPLGGWVLTHRARVEERRLRLVPSVVVRARYQLRAARPVGEGSPWSWLVFDEVLYTVRGAGLLYVRGLDRQRVGGGLSRTLSAHVTVEGGYMWQVLNRPTPARNQSDHAVLMGALYRF